MSTLAGQSVGKYKLLERLGRGGMAEVYKAHHPKLDRTVAVKILHGYLAEGEDFLGRFEREARAVAILRHPHIVQIHDFDVDNATYYMVMEYIDGGTLQYRMDELKKAGKYMPFDLMLTIMKQVGEALDYAHRKGIIHRDIKPSNILLSDSGEAFLADFGIARMVSSTQFTSTGALIGTPTYMSPEQSKGLELTAASDIYSLGVILYELLTGQAPFAADTPLAVIQKHVSEPLPPPGMLRPALPAAVEGVVEKALAKEPNMRYQSAGDLAQALAQVLTADLIAELDQDVTKKTKKKLAPQPTEKMSEADLPGRERLPTVAMSQEERAGIGIKPPPAPPADSVPEEPSVPVGEPKPGTAKGISRRAAKSGKAPGPSWKERFSLKPIMFGLIGLVIVVVLIIVFASLPKTTECQSVEDCIALADDMIRQENREGAIEAYGRAGEMVPLQEHQPNAWIWCTRADLLEQVGRRDEAMANREMCTVWQREEDLEGALDPPIATLEVPRNTDAIAGNWNGTISSQDGTFSTSLELSIQPDCEPGRVCGTFSTPQVPCSGALFLQEIAGETFVFIEQNVTGAASCASGGYEYLQPLTDGTLAYEFAFTPGSADKSTGILFRP